MVFIGGGQEPRIEATKSGKRSGRGGVLTEHAFYTLFSLSMHTSIRHSAQTLLARSLWLRYRGQGKTSSTHVSSSWLILLFVVAVSSLWLIYYCADLCWLLWTQVHGSVVRAVDCRSAGPWFNSGWRSWFTFMTCSDNPMNQISQMFISMSPITRNTVKTFSKICKKKFTKICKNKIQKKKKSKKKIKKKFPKKKKFKKKIKNTFFQKIFKKNSKKLKNFCSQNTCFPPCFSMRVSLLVFTSAQCTLMSDSRSHYTAFRWGWLKTESRGKNFHGLPHVP